MTKCLFCEHQIDAASPLGENTRAVPDEGSVSVCMYCTNVSVFTGNGLETRQATAEEREEILTDPEVQRVIEAMVAMWLKTGMKKGTKFSCGCVLLAPPEPGGTLVFRPCSSTCTVHAMFVEQARRKGKPLQVNDLRPRRHRRINR